MIVRELEKQERKYALDIGNVMIWDSQAMHTRIDLKVHHQRNLLRI